MTHGWSSSCLGLGLSGVLAAGGVVAASSTTQAQITPDNTLGSESSMVTPNVLIRGLTGDRIDGGATRGANLFHSFFQFNIGSNQRVYFTNPAGVANIFSRVTGADPSRILGTLGVDGGANLYLINPQGILFGSNARLDVAGSFTASTAETLVFGEGLSFSATNPGAVPLLTVNLRPGLQFGGTPATIASTGNLTAGKDLLLAAGNLDLQGQLQAGGDLTLRATDTLRIRDSATLPFIAFAGGKFQAQGDQAVDIFALNHPSSGLYSGGDMVLRSGGEIAGDAHYYSGGNFQIEQLDGSLGGWFSPYDPIIRAAGNVSFTNYTGQSLHILAGGSVTVTGNINISGAATNTSTFLTGRVILSDGTPVDIDGSARSTLDIRAGTTNLNGTGSSGITGTNPSNLNPGTAPTSAEIRIDGSVLFNINAAQSPLILLTNQYEANLALPNPNITVGTITARTNGGGGSLLIDSRGDINLNRTVDLRARNIAAAFTGNGGNAILLAGGNINLIAPNSQSQILADGLLGGTIQLQSREAISITNQIGSTVSSLQSRSESTTGGKGGDISLTGRTINLINTIPSATSTIFPDVILAETTGAATGGSIILNASNALTVKDGVQVTARTSGTGAGGTVTVQTPDLRLDNNSQIRTLTQGAGPGGDLTVRATSISLQNDSGLVVNTQVGSGRAGTLTVQGLNSAPASLISLDSRSLISSSTGSDASSSGTGLAGDIALQVRSLQLTNAAQIAASTFAGGNAGTVTITNADVISLDGSSGIFSTAQTNSRGNGGKIQITTGSLRATSGAAIQASTLGTGNAGLIEIQASTIEFDGVGSNGPSTISSAALPGSAGSGGDIELQARSINFTNGATISATNNSTQPGSTAGTINLNASDRISFSGVGSNGLSSRVSLTTTGPGDGGRLQLNTGSLSITGGAQLISSTTAQGDAGGLNIRANNSVLLAGAGSGLFATTQVGSSGNGGEIFVDSPSITVRDGARISVETRGSGSGGTLELNTGALSVLNGGQLRSNTSAQGDAGNLVVKALNSVLLAGSDSGLFATTAVGSSGNGGLIFVDPPSVVVRDGAQISVSSQGSGRGGDVELYADRLTLDNRGSITADTVGSNGGNIRLFIAENLFLRRNSRISTNAGTAQAGGNGGNITITTPFLIAGPQENNDISANAFSGRGGSVTINTQGIFWLVPRSRAELARLLGTNDPNLLDPSRLPSNDITAISQENPDLSGTVAINTPGVDPSQGLTTLPGDLVDPSRLVAQGCSADRGNIARSTGEFIVTGRGGLPPSPSDSLGGSPVWQDLRAPGTAVSRQPQTIAQSPRSKTIVEAQTWVIRPGGEVMLTAQAETTTPHAPWVPITRCQQQ